MSNTGEGINAGVLEAARRLLIETLLPRRDDRSVRISVLVRREVPDAILDDKRLAEGYVAAVRALVEFGTACLAVGGTPSGALPETAVEQVRRAAAADVPEAVILRRYGVGFRDFWTWVDEVIDDLQFSDDPRLNSELRRALGRAAHALQHELHCLFQEQIARVYASEPGPGADRVWPLEKLTSRELEVFDLMQQSTSDKDIAKALGIAWSTARGHAENVLRKLGVSSRRELRPDSPPPKNGG